MQEIVQKINTELQAQWNMGWISRLHADGCQKNHVCSRGAYCQLEQDIAWSILWAVSATVDCGYRRPGRHLKMHHGAGGSQQSSVAQEKSYDYKACEFWAVAQESRARRRRMMVLQRTPAHKFVPMTPESHRRMAFVASCHTGPGSWRLPPCHTWGTEPVVWLRPSIFRDPAP